MKNCLLLFLWAILVHAASAQPVSIIPKPVSMKTSPGSFSLSASTPIVIANESDRRSANFLNDYLQQVYGFRLPVRTAPGAVAIRLKSKSDANNSEAYSFVSSSGGVNIEGDSPAGTFYGIQTLIQLLPVEKQPRLSVPFVQITDQPRFTYRGLHLDVGRHMFPLSFIKKYIDYIALHKLNYFHWHLTEDQGWRIEIKKYPLLTQVGGYRKGTIIGRSPGTGFDNKPYGGFYTQEEVKEVVRYAMDRHINVIPEIEMPGHASAALAAYPHLGCPGTGPYEVEGRFGVFDDIFCAGTDSTFQFLQDVLDEVIPLFPAKYVHIGGDEAPKNNWKICARCQKRIKDNNLKDEHELQSYFVQRIEKHINGKGKTMIGWDEILEGGLAPNAIVMSWRGEAGGIEAAKQNHQVIMTPGSHVYFDHSQTLREDSVTIGGYTTVEKTYSYEPIPKELNAEQAKYVLGAQANMWTEYMKNPKKVEYHLFPRLSALSEVLWSPKEARDWNDFEPRMLHQLKRYDLWGSNYSRAYFDINTAVSPSADNKGITIGLSTKDKEGRLKFRVNGGKETDYTSPYTMNESGSFTSIAYDRNGAISDSLRMNFDINKATGKEIKLSEGISLPAGQSTFILTDGMLNERGIRNNESLSFQSNVDFLIDLGSATQVSNVRVHTLNGGGTTVYPPKGMAVSGSVDGKTFKPLANATMDVKANKAIFDAKFNAEQVRYVKVSAEPLPAVPEGRRGAGQKTTFFVDEIQVY